MLNLNCFLMTAALNGALSHSTVMLAAEIHIDGELALPTA